MEVRVKPAGLIFAGERVPMRPSLKRYSLEEVIRNMLILRSESFAKSEGGDIGFPLLRFPVFRT